MKTLFALLSLSLAATALAETETIIVGLPDGAVSEYLETGAAGVSLMGDANPLQAMFTLGLIFRKELDADAYLLVSFDDPRDPAREPIVLKRIVTPEEQKKEVLLMSEPFADLKCRTYRAQVLIFERKDGKLKALGSHVQLIQSTVDFSRMKTMDDLAEGQCRVI